MKDNGPCRDTDVAATKILDQFKNLCTTAAEDLRKTTVCLQDKEIISKAEAKVKHLLNHEWGK